MRSRHHFPMSLAVGAACVPLVSTPLGSAGLVVYAGLLGTLVDLDHFLIARHNTGSWDPLRRALASPRVALVDQDEIFEDGDVGPLERLLSHALIAGILVGGFGVVSPPLAAVTAAVLSVHVVADLAWDVSRGSVRSDGAGTHRQCAGGRDEGR